MAINNNRFQKTSNISVVSNLIRLNPNCSRVEIAKELGLYKSTVTNITQTLIDSNVVLEVEAQENVRKSLGRKAIGLKLNSNFGCVVGFDLQPSQYRAVIVNFEGTVLWEDIGDVLSLSFEELILYVMKKALAVVKLINLPLLAACFGIPGIVDSAKGIIKHSDAFKLYDFDVYSFGKKHFNVPFLVENDANCCAWYEIANNERSLLGDFISIYSAYHYENAVFNDTEGIGIGLALAIDNKVYSGSTSSAGEFCSYSWNGDGQTGIDPEILHKAKHDKEAFKVWFKNICLSMIPIVSVLNPLTLYLHGNPFISEENIINILTETCPELLNLMKERKCKLIYDNARDFIVAKGASMMYLQKLFNLPTLEEISHRPYVDWSLAFEQNALKEDYEKRGEEDVSK